LTNPVAHIAIERKEVKMKVYKDYVELNVTEYPFDGYTVYRGDYEGKIPHPKGGSMKSLPQAVQEKLKKALKKYGKTEADIRNYWEETHPDKTVYHFDIGWCGADKGYVVIAIEQPKEKKKK